MTRQGATGDYMEQDKTTHVNQSFINRKIQRMLSVADHRKEKQNSETKSLREKGKQMLKKGWKKER